MEKYKQTNVMLLCDVRMFLCTTKYDVKHLQAKIQNVVNFLFKEYVFFKIIYNKPYTTNHKQK